MATESLIIELDARTKKLDAKLQSTEARLDGVEGATKKADKGFHKLSAAASGGRAGIGKGASIAKVGVASLLAMQGAMLGMAKVAAEQAKEISNAAELTKVSVEQMQALGFATETVGVSMEQMADIAKDTSEKVGDFINTGGGGFQDFADAMGLTAIEADKTAKSLQGLTGEQILSKMTTDMEAAGLSGEQMSHALEGMASDTTKLIPLLKNGGAAMAALKQEFYETNVVLSETDISALGEMEKNFASLGATFNATMGKFSVLYQDQINNMIEDTQQGLKIVGDEFSSGAFIDRLNSFYDVFTGSWSDAFGDNIEVSDEFVADMSEAVTSLGKMFLDFTLTLPLNMKIGAQHVKELFYDMVDEIKIALAELDVSIQRGLDVFGEGDIAGAEAKLELIKTETDARDVQAESELETLRALKEARLEAFEAEQEQATIKREQYAKDSADRMIIADQEAQADAKRLQKRQKTEASANKILTAGDKKASAEKTKNLQTSLQAASVLNKLAFDDNKKIGAGLIVASTAVAVMSEYKTGGLPAAILAGLTGAAQLAALNGASTGGGGSVSAPSSSPAPAQDFQQETASQEVSTNIVGDESSTNVQTVTFNSDGGSAADEFLSMSMNEAQRRGSLTVR